MKPQTIFRKTAWVLALGFASALTLCACKCTSEQPAKSEHPAKSDQPQKEHPEHPQSAPAQK